VLTDVLPAFVRQNTIDEYLKLNPRGKGQSEYAGLRQRELHPDRVLGRRVPLWALVGVQ
jgi:hypothetical protein